MRKRHFTEIAIVTCLVALVIPMAQSWSANQMHMDTKAPVLTLEQLYTKQLPLLSQAVADVRKAVEMGHKEHALAELTKVENLLTIVHQTLASHVKPAFVNATCPIMGGKIDPAKVTPDLVREYHGQKVADPYRWLMRSGQIAACRFTRPEARRNNSKK